MAPLLPAPEIVSKETSLRQPVARRKPSKVSATWISFSSPLAALLSNQARKRASAAPSGIGALLDLGARPDKPVENGGGGGGRIDQHAFAFHGVQRHGELRRVMHLHAVAQMRHQFGRAFGRIQEQLGPAIVTQNRKRQGE